MKVADDNNDGTTTTTTTSRVGYREPDVEHHRENDYTKRRLGGNDPEIAGLDIFLPKFSVEIRQGEYGDFRGERIINHDYRDST